MVQSEPILTANGNMNQCLTFVMLRTNNMRIQLNHRHAVGCSCLKLLHRVIGGAPLSVPIGDATRQQSLLSNGIIAGRFSHYDHKSCRSSVFNEAEETASASLNICLHYNVTYQDPWSNINSYLNECLCCRWCQSFGRPTKRFQKEKKTVNCRKQVISLLLRMQF